MLTSPWSLQAQDMLCNRALKIEWNRASTTFSFTPLDECTFSIYDAHNKPLAIIKEKFDSAIPHHPDIRLRKVEYIVNTPNGIPMFKITKPPSRKKWLFAVYTMDGRIIGNVVKKASTADSVYELYVFNEEGQRTLFCTFSTGSFKRRFTLRNTSGRASGVIDLSTGFSSLILSDRKETFTLALDKDYIKTNNLLKSSKILEFLELPHSFGRMAVLIAGVVSYQFDVSVRHSHHLRHSHHDSHNDC